MSSDLGQAYDGPIGPGVAGQTKALAYDPDNVGWIYAGGDVNGVTFSDNNGRTWTPINNGLETGDLTSSFYVDDLIVIGAGDPANPVPVARRGVYAATHGGIYFLQSGSSTWSLLTDYRIDDTYWYTYTGSSAGARGKPIPYSCFGFDADAGVLYAGAGQGGRDQSDGSPWRPYYPECPTGPAKQYSLWEYNLTAPTTPSWSYVEQSSNLGTMRQFAIVEVGSQNVVTFSSRNGIFVYEPLNPIVCENILSSYGREFVPGVWSGKAWGVAAGSNSILYALLTEGIEAPDAELEAEVLYNPGVWTVDLSLPEHARRFVLLDGDSDAVPHSGMSWIDILANDASDLYSLTVIPGDGTESDQVFVGSSSTVYGGLWRHGEYHVDGQTDPVAGWMHVIHINPATGWDYFDYRYINYESDPYTITSFDPGWLTNYTLISTVPMVWHPLDPNTMFAMAYHFPMGMDSSPGEWDQRNCFGGPEYWSSRGLNLMTPRAIEFTADERMVVGAGDFETFISADRTGVSFKWLDHWAIGSKDVNDIEIVGNDIYVIRNGPRKGVSDHTECFGFDYYNGGGDPAWDRRPRQQLVIAKYNPDICEYKNPYGDGYCWEFLSRDFDSIYPDHTYKISNIEIVDGHTMFASVQYTANGVPLNLAVYKATLGGGDWVWDTSPWWTTTLWTSIPDMLYVPGSDRLIVTLYNTDAGGGVWAIDVDNRNTAEPWLVTSGDASTWTHKQRMVKFAQTLACDPEGEFLYVGSHGALQFGETYEYIGGVLRLEVLDTGVPTENDWVAIMNGEGEPYTTYDVPHRCDTWATSATNRLTDVRAIAVDPVNPLHVYVGVACIPYWHPNNGVWEYVPPATSGGAWNWSKRTEITSDMTSAGVVELGLPWYDLSTLFIGTFGTELFKMTVEASGTPTVAAVEPLHEGQTLLLVAGLAANGSESVTAIAVDGSPLGLAAEIPLNDSGTGGDWAVDDGIWTADLGAVTAAVGTYELPVVARDGIGFTLRGLLPVVVVDPPAVYYRNDSRATGAQFTGQPSGVAAVDMINQQSLVADLDRDLYISALDDGIGDPDRGTTLYYTNRVGDIPQFFDESSFRFPFIRPAANHGPATAGDFTGDGLADLVIPAGTSGAGILFFKQEETDGTYSRRDRWRTNIPTSPIDMQADTWSAALGDYNGDGQLDLYVCRSTASQTTGMPGPGSQALPDILLLNDAANLSMFADATAELEIPVDGQGAPIHFASTAAAWGDYDNDGDLDLALADGAGKGIFIYENDPDTGNHRFEIAYPPDPANPVWPRRVSDVAWADLDGDGDLDLVASTFPDLIGDAECHVFLNDELPVNGRFTAPTFVSGVPAGQAITSVRILDQELDGDLDCLLLPDTDDGAPTLVINDGTGYTAASDDLGLKHFTGPVNGGLVTDLNGDGTAELFLGRSLGGYRFFGTAQTAPGSTNPWIGFDLRLPRTLSDGTIRSVPAVGARVEVEVAPGNTVCLTVAADGQSDHVLHIGVAPGHQPDCTIYWPSGHVSQMAGSAVDVVHQLSPPTAFTIDDASVRGFPEVKPGEVVDWVFRWSTSYQTEVALDRVVFVDTVGDCNLSVTELKPGDPDVTVKQWAFKSGDAVIYNHELRWSDQPCARCSQYFEVQSGRAATTSTSGQKLFKNKLCTSIDPNDPPGGI